MPPGSAPNCPVKNHQPSFQTAGRSMLLMSRKTLHCHRSQKRSASIPDSGESCRVIGRWIGQKHRKQRIESLGVERCGIDSNHFRRHLR
jgi:hypothetical protein